MHRPEIILPSSAHRTRTSWPSGHVAANSSLKQYSVPWLIRLFRGGGVRRSEEKRISDVYERETTRKHSSRLHTSRFCGSGGLGYYPLNTLPPRYPSPWILYTLDTLSPGYPTPERNMGPETPYPLRKDIRPEIPHSLPHGQNDTSMWKHYLPAPLLKKHSHIMKFSPIFQLYNFGTLFSP